MLHVFPVKPFHLFQVYQFCFIPEFFCSCKTYFKVSQKFFIYCTEWKKPFVSCLINAEPGCMLAVVMYVGRYVFFSIKLGLLVSLFFTIHSPSNGTTFSVALLFFYQERIRRATNRLILTLQTCWIRSCASFLKDLHQCTSWLRLDVWKLFFRYIWFLCAADLNAVVIIIVLSGFGCTEWKSINRMVNIFACSAFNGLRVFV